MEAVVRKVTTPRKNIRLPVSKKTSPVKAPKGQKTHREDISKAEKDSILECNDRVEDQKEAIRLRAYLNTKFPDIMKEQLEKGDTMDVDPVELVMLNGDVSPY